MQMLTSLTPNLSLGTETFRVERRSWRRRKVGEAEGRNCFSNICGRREVRGDLCSRNALNLIVGYSK